MTFDADNFFALIIQDRPFTAEEMSNVVDYLARYPDGARGNLRELSHRSIHVASTAATLSHAQEVERQTREIRSRYLDTRE